MDLGISNVVEILDVRDSSNAKYYEVDYLAQDRILKEIHYNEITDENDSRYRSNVYDQQLSGDSTRLMYPYHIP